MSTVMESASRDLGAPVELDPVTHPCRCVVKHVPALRATHRHHVLPLAWGGPDTDDNVVPICPSGHDIIHGLLRRWERLGEPQPRGRGNEYLHAIALDGWSRRTP